MERSVAPGRSREDRSKLVRKNGPCLMKGGCHAFYRNLCHGCYWWVGSTFWMEAMER